MTPERWQRVKELFDAASELEAEERVTFLDRECAGDQELRREVESLLESDDDSDSFMESPAVEDAADSLAGDEEKLEAGQKIGRYEIVSLAGEGGMGEVYLAHDSRLGRKVALKLLPAYLSKDKSRLRRFEQEARSASALSHPNVCMIHEVGEMADESRPYIAMEFVDGITLRQRLQQGEIKLGESLDITIQVASALTAAHEAGITHRDIKPENIMIRRDGYVKVLDFGLAKLAEQQRQTTSILTKSGIKTEPGMVLGTPQYMSPEQARGQAVDTRTDIWALGAVLYEITAGRAPFEGDTTSDIIAGVLEREPVPLARYAPKLPENVEWIISKALRKDKEERYQTSKELLTDLRSVKQRLEFEVELERSTPPNKASGAITALFSSEQSVHSSAPPTSEVDSSRRTSSAEYVVREVRQHKLGAGIAFTFLLAAIVGLTYFFYFVPSTKAAISSIAVLPFVNVSNDPNTEYLSDGISESLINSLSQLPEMKVIARSSSFTYKDKEVDLQEVAKTLGVQAIVTGRVIQRGDNLQISAEVMNASNRTQIWGEQYTRKMADLQTIQSEISKEIAGKLRVKLTGAQEQELAKKATQNPRAYQLYLNGQFYIRKGSMDDYKKALDYYNQAIALDPNFALAYAGAAYAYGVLGANSEIDPKETDAKGKAAITKALELDDTLAEAHVALGILKVNDWDWIGAEREFKRAIELNPNLADGYLQYAQYLYCVGRFTEALAMTKQVQELDPLLMDLKALEGIILIFSLRYDEAIEKLQNVVKLEPENEASHIYLCYAYNLKGRYAEAISEAKKILSKNEDYSGILISLGYAYAKSGKRDEALAILNKLKTTKDYASPAELAILYVGLGDKEKALQSLERAYAAHDLQMQFIKFDPYFDSLRSEPRFQDLLRRMNFPA